MQIQVDVCLKYVCNECQYREPLLTVDNLILPITTTQDDKTSDKVSCFIVFHTFIYILHETCYFFFTPCKVALVQGYHITVFKYLFCSKNLGTCIIYHILLVSCQMVEIQICLLLYQESYPLFVPDRLHCKPIRLLRIDA